MARIRTIKPSFFKSEDVSALPLRARLTWIGLWTHCDDQGRTKDNVKLIKAEVWPLDQVTLAEVEEDLATLAAHGRIVRYEVDGRRYLEIANWSEHQSINRPTPSKIPAPPNGSYPQVSAHAQFSEGSHQEGKGREGKGRAPAREPPLKCQQHTDDSNPPACGNCADARRANEKWHAERRTRTRAAPKCRRHRGQLAEHCALCRSEQLAT